MSEKFQYDVFLSYSSKDKSVVRKLAKRLKADGLRVWLDEWVIQPGEMIGLKIQEGLEKSRTLILVMSSSYFKSEWATLEHHTLLFRDPTNKQRRFIPLLIEDCTIPDIIAQFSYIDWREKSKKAYQKLLTTCRSEAETPAKPPVQKEFIIREAKVLKGHEGAVISVAVTPDGEKAISASFDNTLKLWDLESGKCLSTFKGHDKNVLGIAITPEGKKAVSGSGDKTLKLWDLESGKCLTTFKGHNNGITHWGVVVSPDGKKVISGSRDRTLKVWDIETAQCLKTFKGHTNTVYGVAITPDGNMVVSGSSDRTLRLWDLKSGDCTATFKGHTGEVNGVAIIPGGKRILSGSDDGTLKVWDLESTQCLGTFEGHAGNVYSVAITPDGKRAVSSSVDKTLRAWNLESGQCQAILEGHTSAVLGVAVTPDGKRVVSASPDETVRVWELPEEIVGIEPAARYTNAKVVLVGESGVGKTGLAIRLIESRFEPTISTDAAWATQMKLPDDTATGDIEREIWLWDFGGQADYRLIHQLFLDETAMAVLVFNPQSENPFEGLGQWDRDLQRAARQPIRKLLVAGRCDRGGLMVSGDSVDGFAAERDFAGFLETSALSGAGCPELREAIIENIDWDRIPWIASPRIFKLLKTAILKLKDDGKVLLRMAELKQQIEMAFPGESFTLEQLRTVVGLLVGPGAVWQLEFGDFILLEPERINAYAAAVIRRVRAHLEEIGCILEEEVMSGNLDYQDMKRLSPDEEQIVLRAMHQTFVDHGLCLREPTDAGIQLVFPSYFKRERPMQEDHPAIFVVYQFSGPLDEIYATLVVRLYHIKAFNKDRLWRFAADFKTQEGKRLGLKMTKKSEGAAEIIIYFEPGIPDDTRVTFIRYIHDHLKSKDPNMTRLRYYVCPHCQAPVENRKVAQDRLARGLKDIICVDCENRVPLLDLIEQKFASDEFRRRVHKMEEQALTNIDNESRELILIGHAFSIAGEAGQIFRPTPISDWGIDGEIEFKDDKGQASGQRIYLQLKHGDSYLYTRKRDEKEIFTIKKPRHAEILASSRIPGDAGYPHLRWPNPLDERNRLPPAPQKRHQKDNLRRRTFYCNKCRQVKRQAVKIDLSTVVCSL